MEDFWRFKINTLDKRTECTFKGEHFSECLNGSYESDTAKPVKLNSLRYLHIPVTKTVEDFQKENIRHVVGIGRGLHFLAVSYDEQGKTEFVFGKQIATKRRKFQAVCRQLQFKGTKSAKRRLKAFSDERTVGCPI